jgi:hypothetical protein
MRNFYSRFTYLVVHRVLRHPLALMFVTILTLMAMLIAFHQTTNNTFDAYILIAVSIVFGLSALFMLLHTQWQKWTVLGSGLVATFLGDAFLYGILGTDDFFNISSALRGFILLNVRTLFVVGGTWILVGLLQEAWIDMNPYHKAYILSRIPRRRKLNGEHS